MNKQSICSWKIKTRGAEKIFFDSDIKGSSIQNSSFEIARRMNTMANFHNFIFAKYIFSFSPEAAHKGHQLLSTELASLFWISKSINELWEIVADLHFTGFLIRRTGVDHRLSRTQRLKHPKHRPIQHFSGAVILNQLWKKHRRRLAVGSGLFL